MQKNRLFLLLLFLSPGFWLPLLNTQKFYLEFKNAPNYLYQKVFSYNSEENLSKVNDLRWVDKNNSGITFYSSKFYYNKVLYISNDILGFIDYMSPRYYFLENTPFILFPIWLFGILFLLKEKKYLFPLILLALNFILFFLGPPNIYILFPSLILILYICSQTIANIKNKKFKKSLLYLIIIYAIYLDGRLIFFNL